MRNISMAALAGMSLAGLWCHGQGVVGKPCLFSDYFAEWRTFPSILRDPEGNLSCGRNRLNNGGATQAPPAGSDPVCLVPPSNWEYVAYVDVFGNAQLLSHFSDRPWRTTWLNGPGIRAGGPGAR